MDTNTNEISKPKLILGGIILVVGFLSPLLIPLVTATNWSLGIKSTVSGLLDFGIPELFILIAVAVMGKQGYEFLKQKAFKFLKPFAPSDQVSLIRYRIGLILFILPIMVGLILPYAQHFFTDLEKIPIWAYIISDVVFITSFFVLGGNFWDKFSGLFKHSAKISQ